MKAAYCGVEEMSQGGPTGRVLEVLEMDLRDAGGNVLQSGKPGTWAFNHCRWQVPVKRVATKTGGEIGHSDVMCDC